MIIEILCVLASFKQLTLIRSENHMCTHGCGTIDHMWDDTCGGVALRRRHAVYNGDKLKSGDALVYLKLLLELEDSGGVSMHRLGFAPRRPALYVHASYVCAALSDMIRSCTLASPVFICRSTTRTYVGVPPNTYVRTSMKSMQQRKKKGYAMLVGSKFRRSKIHPALH